jgi:predicted nuclease of restriction endonuclease-like RecB superfamily
VVSAHVALARCSVHGGVVTPHWLTARDHPWIAELIELHRAFAGEPRQRLDERLVAIERKARTTGTRLVAEVLGGYFGTEVAAEVQPTVARMTTFAAAAGFDRTAFSWRVDALARAASALGVSPEAVDRSLFADLPGERRLKPLTRPIHADEVALRCNLAVAQAALSNSSALTIALEGHARALVRHARLRGLICTVVERGEMATLSISGPLALFRRTALYGRHLAELAPLLAWSRDFRLEADCSVRGGVGRFVLDRTAPLPPSAEPRRFDSRLEERFARDFLRLTAEWDIVREPEAVAVEGTLIFPDFAIVHRHDPSRRWLLEILGFWTADYVASKLRRLREAGLPRLLLCIDAARDCGHGALPPDARVLRFEKRVDAQGVLEVLEGDSIRACSARSS